MPSDPRDVVTEQRSDIYAMNSYILRGTRAARSAQARPRHPQPARPDLHNADRFAARPDQRRAARLPASGEPRGARRIRWHDLRHTAVTYCSAAGVPLPNVGDWIGHADSRVTEINRHNSKDSEDSALDLLDRFDAERRIADTLHDHR